MNNIFKSIVEFIFSVFIGTIITIISVGFLDLFFDFSYGDPNYEVLSENKSFYGGFGLLIAGTVFMMASLFMKEKLRILDNGLLFGGIFTTIYATGLFLTQHYDDTLLRLLFTIIVLLILCVIGWLKFKNNTMNNSSSTKHENTTLENKKMIDENEDDYMYSALIDEEYENTMNHETELKLVRINNNEESFELSLEERVRMLEQKLSQLKNIL